MSERVPVAPRTSHAARRHGKPDTNCVVCQCVRWVCPRVRDSAEVSPAGNMRVLPKGRAGSEDHGAVGTHTRHAIWLPQTGRPAREHRVRPFEENGATMTVAHIRFDDGLGYEQYMGKWSQLVAQAFLEWLAPATGLHWLDIGCGNGAFTESVVQGCAPTVVDAIDPSPAQLAFARARLAGRTAFAQADAMAQPFRDDAVEVAVMPLVIFFVPEPSTGVAEMARVIRPGGLAAAYAWDMEGGGFPYQPLHDEMRAAGITVPVPPSGAASRVDVLRDLWRDAGLEDVQTRVITVERTFQGPDEYWATVLKGPSVGNQLRGLPAPGLSALQARMRAHLPTAGDGRITCRGRAHAVKGRVRPR